MKILAMSSLSPLIFSSINCPLDRNEGGDTLKNLLVSKNNDYGGSSGDLYSRDESCICRFDNGSDYGGSSGDLY